MTTVVIDLERLKFLQCGLGQFSLHLGRAILDETTDDIEPILLVPRGGEFHFAPRSPRTIPAMTWRKECVAGWLRPLVSAWPRRSRIDLWHVTHQDSKYWPIDSRVPVVMTVHDLNFLREKPASVIRRRLQRLRKMVSRASILTTGSQYAADEIREHVAVPGQDIRVIPHGVCLDRIAKPDRPVAVAAQSRYLFTIGDITPKKNFHVLVEMVWRLPGFSLVIAGSKSHAYAQSIERRAAELGLSQRVILPGRVTESERNWLYQHCAAFLFPSLTEGFGLPLIEAMSYGRPVITARNTSLPEVGGPLAFYWDSFDVSHMVDVFQAAMDAFSGDPRYADKLRARANQFRWPEAARRYLDLYREVLGVAKRKQRTAA